ncbi:MAG: hypothetical protein AAF889_08865 [Cyanobacteria bacterium P01_D01_bin.73]
MGINALTFQSQFTVGLYNHFLDEFLSLTPPQSSAYDISIPAHQLSLESTTNLGAEPSQFLTVSLGHSEAIAATPMGLSQTVMAQKFEETDLAAQVQEAWGNFVESGQIWALIIGVVFGYMFRTFTGG